MIGYSSTVSFQFRMPKMYLRRRKWRVSGAFHSPARSRDDHKGKGLDRYYKRRVNKTRFNLFKYNLKAY
jgi:hypothetical protein